MRLGSWEVTFPTATCTQLGEESVGLLLVLAVSGMNRLLLTRKRDCSIVYTNPPRNFPSHEFRKGQFSLVLLLSEDQCLHTTYATALSATLCHEHSPGFGVFTITPHFNILFTTVMIAPPHLSVTPTCGRACIRKPLQSTRAGWQKSTGNHHLPLLKPCEKGYVHCNIDKLKDLISLPVKGLFMKNTNHSPQRKFPFGIGSQRFAIHDAIAVHLAPILPQLVFRPYHPPY